MDADVGNGAGDGANVRLECDVLGGFGTWVASALRATFVVGFAITATRVKLYNILLCKGR